MNNQVSIVLVGMGGYGNIYLKELLHGSNENAYLQGVVDVSPERSNFHQEIVERNIPIFHSLEEFYQVHTADLAIISTPIQFHKHQSCLAMEHGSHVLCEKPATADPQQLQEMIETRDRTNKKLAIGFNWSFTDTVQQLKQDILDGKFGRALRMKSLVLWPRTADYYNRSSWAGKQFSPDGERIFDSVANNATAHFLHHLFYLAGDSMETSAEIEQLSAELYRANPIETFDTCAVKIQTTNQIEIIYLASHAVMEEHRPTYTLEFEQATISYQPEGTNGEIQVTWKDGTMSSYEDPERNHLSKLGVMITAIQDGTDQIRCGAEAARTHVEAIYAMHESVPEIPKFPEELIHYHQQQRLTTVEGLEKLLTLCYQEGKLPHELGAAWSSAGATIHIH